MNFNSKILGGLIFAYLFFIVLATIGWATAMGDPRGLEDLDNLLAVVPYSIFAILFAIFLIWLGSDKIQN
jgi:hypothetical protein